MNIHTPELIEGYVLEIISRARVVKGRCESLLSKDFASDAPKHLAETLINICKYLELAIKSLYQSIDWANVNKVAASVVLLQTSDSIIRELGSHIRYIDGAQTQKLPWSLISPLEKYLKKFRSDIEIMFRPQWKYNYTIITTNLYDYYLNTLTRYKTYVKEKSWEDILKPLNKYFYIVSFPSIERKNILLHCLLGHEIGHLEAKEYVQQRSDEFLQSIRDKIVPIVEARIKNEYQNVPPLFMPQFTQQMVQAEIKRTVSIWQQGLEEILSDIIGSYLFGPAVLFSNLEFSLQDLNGLDKIPDEDNNYYPPWRMRLRNIFEVIKELRLFPFKEDVFESKRGINNITKRFKLVEEIVNEKSDKEALEKNNILKIAYEEIEKDIEKAKIFYSNKLKALLLNSDDFYKHLPHLLDKIYYGIPPNAFEKSINEREPATIVEIINTAWFHKLSWEDQLFDEENKFKEDICEKRDRMNRLALKALEYSDIERDYFDWHFNKTGNFPKYEKAIESCQSNGLMGVLTEKEIVISMNEDKIAERLIVTPVFNPAELFDASSINVRLGNEFIAMRKQSFPILDIADGKTLVTNIERYQEKIRLRYHEKFVLHPRQLIIGSTLEYISLPCGVMCYVVGKSTWGRMGLIIATATKVDPGFKGCITLEIINEGEVPIILYPGIPVAQLVFHTTSSNATYEGKYSCPTGPQFPKFTKNIKDWEFWYPPSPKE